ncbi:DUF3333 domain-containing protein [Rappaport israeli]|uniref:DUF3333 domain-containing protein n=1 Tax=Rappaport israeli TaxID=1839807 RepID=UPI0011782AE6
MHHLDSQLKKRHAQEKRFRYYGIASLSLALLFLIGFFISIIRQAMPAMLQTQIQVEVYFDPALLNLPSNDPPSHQPSQLLPPPQPIPKKPTPRRPHSPPRRPHPRPTPTQHRRAIPTP